MCGMDWEDLRYVLELERGVTLARAATSIGVTHTTVGRRLRAMEDRLGVRLFDRTPDGFVPTPAGRDLADVARQIEDDVLAAERRMVGRDARLRGPLRISTMDMFVCGFYDVFDAFVERYPGIELTIDTSLHHVSLPRREADVLLRLTNQPPDYLVGRKVGRVEFAVYAADRLVDAIGLDAGLGAYPWLGWDERSDSKWLDGWLAEHAPTARTVLRIDDSERVREHAVQAGTGVFFLPCFVGDTLPGVQRISPVVHEFGHDVWILTLRELRHNHRVRAFMDHVGEALAALKDGLAGLP
jgi:DNA-binding transcriptional LysR family regulator